MKYLKFLPVVIFLLIPFSTYGATSTVIKCPKPPKNQPVVNYFLTSFTDPAENLQNYIPRDLVLVSDIDTYNYSHYCLRKPVYDAFKRMNKALKKQTGMTLQIRSGFRSYKVQENFKKIFGGLAASPGRSEHQLGTALDLIGTTPGEKLADSKEYIWLTQNAAKYGFVQSYPNETINEPTDPTEGLIANLQATAIQPNLNNTPPEKQPDVTPGEAWHWRYIGESTAVAMPAGDLGTYLDQVKINQAKKTNKKP